MKKLILVGIIEVVLAVVAVICMHWVNSMKWNILVKIGVIGSITMCYIILGAASAMYCLGDRDDECD